MSQSSTGSVRGGGGSGWKGRGRGWRGRGNWRGRGQYFSNYGNRGKFRFFLGVYGGIALSGLWKSDRVS